VGVFVQVTLPQKTSKTFLPSAKISPGFCPLLLRNILGSLGITMRWASALHGTLAVLRQRSSHWTLLLGICAAFGDKSSQEEKNPDVRDPKKPALDLTLGRARAQSIDQAVFFQKTQFQGELRGVPPN